MMPPSGSIVKSISGCPKLKTLTSLLKKAHLINVLSGDVFITYMYLQTVQLASAVYVSDVFRAKKRSLRLLSKYFFVKMKRVDRGNRENKSE